jgi:hypothetical protein
MIAKNVTYLDKLAWSLPWLLRYPLWRARELIRRATEKGGPQNLLFFVANHYEPGWAENGLILDWSTQMRRVEDWCRRARATGRAVRDTDGRPFRHTYFYPGEQYHRGLLEQLAELQAEGFGEVEIHLHHGVGEPDTAESLRQALTEFRDCLAEEHKCLSRPDGTGGPMYAFVHGNSALANSAGGRFCGVDSEMQILAETGCYADFTLPSAPDQTQVPRINAIYQCGRPLHEAVPHRTGPNLRVGETPTLPVLFTGPLVFDWRRRVRGLPIPRIEDGALAANYPLTLARLHNWRRARIGIYGRPEWIFIKLYCHGFFPHDQATIIGEPIRRFLSDVVELSEREGDFTVHFVTAREAFNIAMAAIDGHRGSPGNYRDYRLVQIMQAESASAPWKEANASRI